MAKYITMMPVEIYIDDITDTEKILKDIIRDIAAHRGRWSVSGGHYSYRGAKKVTQKELKDNLKKIK